LKAVKAFLPAFFIALLTALPPSGCSSRPAIPGAVALSPGITGVITALRRQGRDLRIMVEERPGELSGSMKASVLVDSATTIRMSGKRKEGSAAAVVAGLKTGDRVSVWFRSPVMESYPVQGTARMIVVDGG